MSSPYLPNTDADRTAMLQEIGVRAVDELFQDVPEKLLNVPFKLPPPLSELELKEELHQLANRNANLEDYACFLGAGSYRHHIGAVTTDILSRASSGISPDAASSTQPILPTRQKPAREHYRLLMNISL